jgi:outer membrane autotransporter protein
MKPQATQSRLIRRMGPGMASMVFGTGFDSGVAPGSGQVALRLGLLLGTVVATGAAIVLSHSAPSEAQQGPPGRLDNSASQNSAQGSMANSIRTFCPQIGASRPDRTVETANLSTICTGMVLNNQATGYQLPQDQLNGTTQTLNGEEVQAMQQQVADVQATQVANITARMDAIRAGLGAPGLSFAGLTGEDGEQILTAGYEDDALAGEGDPLVGEGGTLSEPIWEKLGVFVTPAGRFGDKSNSGKVTGYDFFATGLTAGADYRLTDDFAVGGAVGYSYYNVDFDKNQDNPSSQDLDSNSVIFSFFGTYFPNRNSLVPLEGLFLDGFASFGWSFFDMSRHIIVPNTNNPTLPSVNEKANSETTAFQYSFGGNLGYEFNVRQFTITPVARVQYVKADVGSYEESGASPINLKVGSQDAKSLTTNLGASLGYAFSTQYGVLEPTIRAEYVHQFERNNKGASIRYASDPTGLSTFNVITEDNNRNYAIVGAALTGTLAGGWSAFGDFETVVGLGNFDIYTFRAGFRKEF